MRNQPAVERKFGIIGAALNRLRQTHPELVERIPSWRKVVAFRNLLPHGDAVGIPDRVSDLVENDLPELHRTVRELLAGSRAPEE